MLTVKHRPLTVHDYMQLPADSLKKTELIEGDLFMSPSPNRFHQEILVRLTSMIWSYLQVHPIGRVYAAPFDVTLTDLNVFQPDICYFSKSRYSSLTEHGADGAPDLVIEVLSAGSVKHDLGVKKEIYARTGVEEFWSVDPVKRTVTVYELGENSTTPKATLGEGKTLTTPLLPGLKIKLREVFAP
ncbi:MAG: Uma2 family endonuclease [Verrucomicrobia bacterium]|nr:Uma2 family endonuclease [Verrucomicrobiota bacterium]